MAIDVWLRLSNQTKHKITKKFQKVNRLFTDGVDCWPTPVGRFGQMSGTVDMGVFK